MTKVKNAPGKPLEAHREAVLNHYNGDVEFGFFSREYRKVISRYIRYIVSRNCSLLEIGCGQGAFSKEFAGVEYHGLEMSVSQLDRARSANPDINCYHGEGESFKYERDYDYILLSDTLNESTDVQALLVNTLTAAHSGTRLIINVHNTLWRPVFKLASFFGLKPKRPQQNWLSKDDVENLLDLSGWELVRRESRILCPVRFLGLDILLNSLFAPLLPMLCLSVFFVARPKASRAPNEQSVSVIIPARNEEGNLENAIKRVPEMGRHTEIIFVEGNSQDNTWEKIQELIRKYPGMDIKGYQQKGKGKGDAMRTGYAHAKGEILMILDADLTVPPEDLPKFYSAINSGSAEFANGVRLVYPMEESAMRFLNMCANKFFSLLFSWLLSVPIKDTLCGTKVFTRETYEKIEANRAYFGEFDPFGDFDLIFGASKLNLKIRDIPIRYQARTYGEPQIDRWRDGALLIRMAIFAARKIKFF